MKANENIRKISEEDNPLFDLMQYRVNLEFISKSKNLQLYNQFKKIILTQFRSVIVQINKIETTIYLKYRILGDKQEDFIPNFSLNLTEIPIIQKCREEMNFTASVCRKRNFFDRRPRGQRWGFAPPSRGRARPAPDPVPRRFEHL